MTMSGLKGLRDQKLSGSRLCFCTVMCCFHSTKKSKSSLCTHAAVIIHLNASTVRKA